MEGRRSAAMKLSTDRILTTHVGSLPRPPDLLAMLEARETGQGFDEAAFEARLARAVREIVEQQVVCGIDSVCDGEQSKISYTFYVRHRLSGLGAFHGAEVDKPPQTAQHLDLVDHPDAAARMIQLRGGVSWFAAAAVPCCTGPVAYRDRRPLDTDLKNLAAVNHATRNIPPASMRLHICWGNYEGPHTHDIPLAKVLDTCMRARPQALLFEAANPRHAHEWEDLQRAKIPDDKILMPGCIDSTTNFVEHPRLIRHRRARARHRRHGLRLCDLRGTDQPGRTVGRLGQAQIARRRSGDRDRPPLGKSRVGWAERSEAHGHSYSP